MSPADCVRAARPRLEARILIIEAMAAWRELLEAELDRVDIVLDRDGLERVARHVQIFNQLCLALAGPRCAGSNRLAS
jgi:hypothetical protein